MEERTTRTFELLEPASPEALVPQPWMHPWMIAVLIGLATGIVLYLILRRVFRKKKRPVPPRELAYREAKQALSSSPLAETPPREAAIAISRILRRYLADASGDSALFETQEEFVARHDSLRDLPAETRAAVADTFARLAAIKYAAHPPAADSNQLHVEAAELLETLHHGRS